jgi:tetratricopeptide (TPR) repeat protein
VTGTSPLALNSSASPDAAKHNAEGMEHYKMGHYDVAKQHFEAATKSDPKSAEAFFNMGLALDKLGDHKQATAYFQRAAAIDPKNSAILQSSEYQTHVNPPKWSTTAAPSSSGSSSREGY